MIKKIIFKLTILLAITSIISCSKGNSKKVPTNQQYSISHDFVQGSEDIPLLVSMKQIRDEGLGFDSPSGSIMSSSYESILSRSDIANFYKKTLPKMGWTLKVSKTDELKFSRENENLEIDLTIKKYKSIIRFLISYDL